MATKKEVANWKEGQSLVTDSGKTIDEIRLYVASGRWALAVLHRRDGNKLITEKPPLYRSAISRYYYAMYHAMRAVVYLSFGGDDHQEHNILHTAFPDDFPDKATLSNTLKSARLDRNAADYDPYPRGEATWKRSATRMRKDANTLLAAARAYLRDKGCVGV